MAGAAIDFRELELQAGDGNRFAAFGAFPEAESDVGVVILPDVRGLYQFYEELALRFAERGCAAVAIDYFGRTAGSEKRGADFEFRPHVEQTTFDGVQADTGAAVAFLRSAKGGSRKRIFTVGFCFGGAASWLAAASGHDLAGAVGFYGRPLLRRNGGPSPVDRAPDIKAPVLALMGGADEGIPVADVEEFRSALIAAAVEHEIRIYPGAPHSFFDRKFEEYADVSADAWGRTLEFIFGPGVPR
jgi:carboxymethylenebutenolidase